MKPLADYTADEALREIQSLINIDLPPGRRIDQLAGHLALKMHNAQTAQREHFLYAEQRLRRLDVVMVELERLLRTTKGRKTVARDDVDHVYRLATR